MGIADIAADALIREVKGVLDDVITSEEERGQLRIELEKVRQAPELKALDERIAFAQHPSLFVAGARPFVIWVAGVGIAWDVMMLPAMNWVLALLAAFGADGVPPIDALGWDKLTILAGLAGGTRWIRHMDKVKGVARSNLNQPDISDASLGRPRTAGEDLATGGQAVIY